MRLPAFTLLLLTYASLPTAAAAQASTDAEIMCGEHMQEYCMPDHHVVLLTPGLNPVSGWHNDCRANPGAHGTCGYAGSAYGELLDAVRLGDRTLVLELAVRAPQFVALNKDRSVLLIRDCSTTDFIASTSYASVPDAARLVRELESRQPLRFVVAVSR